MSKTTASFFPLHSSISGTPHSVSKTTKRRYYRYARAHERAGRRAGWLGDHGGGNGGGGQGRCDHGRGHAAQQRSRDGTFQRTHQRVHPRAHQRAHRRLHRDQKNAHRSPPGMSGKSCRSQRRSTCRSACGAGWCPRTHTGLEHCEAWSAPARSASRRS